MASIKLKGDTSGEITISSPSVAGTNTLELQATSGTLATTAQASIGMKNLIINGNMQIAQRGTSATGITGNGLNTVDRFTRELSAAGTWTMSQDTDVPSGQGFASSMKYLCTTANASLSSGSYFAIESRNEGQNFQQLKYGSANAESVTLSFWVKSNKTGTYSIEFLRVDANRSQTQIYTIDSADTWEKKTVTIVGDIVGAIDNDNGDGYRILWWMGAGTTFTSGTLATSWASITSANRVSSSNVNLADSTSNYINITGVQLEAGTVATPFENLQYGQQLALCQRYLQSSWSQGSAIGSAVGLTTNSVQQSWGSLNAGIAGQAFLLPVTMRTSPTLVVYDMALTTGKITTLGNGAGQISNVSANNSATTTNMFYVRLYANNQAGMVFAYTLTAEL